jgi:hypothetical protein
MNSAKTPVYLILGAAGSGRREIVADLIEGGLAGDSAGQQSVLSLLATGEAAAACDSRLGRLARWTWADGRIESPDLDGAATVFFFADGRRNPVDQIEAFQPWLAANGGELARIICVIHCGLAAQHKPLLVWFDACVHFADVVLLNRRDGVANKWMSDFRARHAAQFLPCVFELVKAGRVENPALILAPQARRMSHFFDEELDWEVTGGDEDEAAGSEAEEIEAHPEEDPWLQRRPGGRRVRVIPDIAKYLA